MDDLSPRSSEHSKFVLIIAKVHGGSGPVRTLLDSGHSDIMIAFRISAVYGMRRKGQSCNPAVLDGRPVGSAPAAAGKMPALRLLGGVFCDCF